MLTLHVSIAEVSIVRHDTESKVLPMTDVEGQPHGPSLPGKNTTSLSSGRRERTDVTERSAVCPLNITSYAWALVLTDIAGRASSSARK